MSCKIDKVDFENIKTRHFFASLDAGARYKTPFGK